MAGETGIAWTDATVNFVLGCAPAGPGCDHCFAKAFVERKWPNIKFKPGGLRHVTQSGFADPLKWQRMHDRGQTHMQVNGRQVPVPVWIFAGSLNDFFDNEWPDGVRDRAWKVIRATPSLRWILVTKRVGNVPDMLPADWDGGRNYPHVGVVCTMVNQKEVDRDARKLLLLKSEYGVRWIGLSVEPQLGPITLTALRGYGGRRLDALRGIEITPTAAVHAFHQPSHPPGHHPGLDWVISGGESKQDDDPARPYDLAWAEMIVDAGRVANIPVFVKQMGDSPVHHGKPLKFKGKGDNVQAFPPNLRVQQMPRVFDNDPPRVPVKPTLPLAVPPKPDPQSSLF